jgi:PBP1b-binding outer membrane lipoprotein LpoB
MKKYLILLVAALTFFFAGCQKATEPGGTAVQNMAGDWWVTCEYQKAGVWTDAGVGHVLFTTYNTAANKATEMWVNDNGSFLSFQSIVNVDYAAKTFSTADSVSTNSASYPTEKVLITNGKILLHAAKTPSGVAADSIVFFAAFNDDSGPIVYKIAGFRRTGFPADNF